MERCNGLRDVRIVLLPVMNLPGEFYIDWGSVLVLVFIVVGWTMWAVFWSECPPY